jgi:hypothetical protein
MLTLGALNHCGNEACLAIYMTPKQYEPLMSFCPCCRAELFEEVEKDKQFWEEFTHDFETELDGPGRC